MTRLSDGSVSSSAKKPCRVSKAVAAPPPAERNRERNCENCKRRERKNERKRRKWNSSTWIGATSFSRCSDFEATTSLSLAENLRSDQRGSDLRGEEEGREIVAKIVHRFLKTSRPLKATERLERAVNLDKSE